MRVSSLLRVTELETERAGFIFNWHKSETCEVGEVKGETIQREKQPSDKPQIIPNGFDHVSQLPMRSQNKEREMNKAVCCCLTLTAIKAGKVELMTVCLVGLTV